MDADFYQSETGRTAVYPPEVAIMYLSLKLASEAGEVAGKIGKWLRGDSNGYLDDMALMAELGDVQWYIARLAEEIGYDLSEVMQRNLDKLSVREANGTLRGDGDAR